MGGPDNPTMDSIEEQVFALASDHRAAPDLGRVLVTGAAGFIGSHLVEAVLPYSTHVRAFVHYNSRNHWGWLEDSDARSNIEVVAGDVRDYESVLSAMRSCDTVCHLAALIGIPYSYLDPLAYLRTNIEGTYNVLQAARECSVANVLITSTSETYGTSQYVPMDESHPLAAQSPYAATKTGADQLALSYCRSFGLTVKVVRPFNTYGPRQSSRAIIPTIICQILSGKPTLRLGNLAPTRDLTFVADTASAFIAIADCPQCTGTVTNIGTNTEVSVGQLVETIAHLLGVSVAVEVDDVRVRPSASEVLRLRCNNEKILSLTHWRPAFDLRSGLQKTVDWFRTHGTYHKAEIYTI